MDSSISVIIPTFNRARYIAEAVELMKATGTGMRGRLRRWRALKRRSPLA